VPPLDHDRCYAAASSRDARFDGAFIVAVRTTGIYCRPSCPAITPKKSNVEFHHTAAAAQQRGFRACKRCLPDATPGSPEWNSRHDVVSRAMRLIGDGVVERDGVGGLARRLGYSERHLNRLLTDEVGAGPLAVARARRAQTARILIETTDLSLTEVAFAAGFGSVRQFNDTIREVFASTPSSLRAGAYVRKDRGAAPRDAPSVGAPVTVAMRLATRRPFAGVDVLRFLALRAIPGVEAVEPDGAYRRLLTLPGGPAAVTLTLPEVSVGSPSDIDHVVASVRVTDWADLSTAVERVRRLLDLDADPVAIDAHLSTDSILGPFVTSVPGRRSPGSIDPFETLVRAIVGQQISVAGARTVIGRIVAAVGQQVDPGIVMGWNGLHRTFPTAELVADAPDDVFSMPTARRDTIRRAAVAMAEGVVALDVGADPFEARTQLLALKGIGSWTADYTVMRALGNPDVMLATDLGVLHAATALGLEDLATTSRRWSPWQSYAVHHLWASLDLAPPGRHDGQPPPVDAKGRLR
jgi:AraC family transcriptional regulator, regulatory protein of adaptative response / DNA-3-methyladenine glycosylase II